MESYTSGVGQAKTKTSDKSDTVWVVMLGPSLLGIYADWSTAYRTLAPLTDSGQKITIERRKVEHG